MKNLKKVLALVLAVVMIMGVVTVASAKTYTDVKATDNYADAIDALSSLNILDGFKDGDNYSFKADGTFTRAQAAKIVAIVHNAATNGTIKGQDAISGLYSNAQNPFVDCNSNWALPFINYCRITGLADGMTATTYAPNRELTGVQWLKLMLTTLNFDTAKEGYTGTGWDVNVLNRANEIGLTAGLAKDWKAIAPIKRGEAAQVLYNALTKYLVEYGQLVKGFDTRVETPVFNAAFVSNEQVAKSGFTLGAKMGISITRATDAFRRPGYNWSYGSWSAFYMDAPVNSYTTAVTMCDILKNDMKVSETSGTVIHLNGHRKGITEGTTEATTKASKLTVKGETVAYTALNYFAVDGRKYAYGNEGVRDVVLTHDINKACQKISGNWWDTKFGGQGDLTQVFQTEDGWVITTIHTFLAEVTAVNKTNKYNHINGETSNLKVWVALERDTPSYPYNIGDPAAKTVATTDYAVGTKLLVTLSLKESETANKADHRANAAVVDIKAADSKIGKLTGASDLAYAESVSIDGTKYPTACRFVLGKDDAMKFAHYGKTFTFYFDSYGNVIGCDKDSTAANYVIVDKIWASHTDDGDFAIKANLYDLEGKAIEKADVAVAGSFANAKKGNPNGASYFWNVAQLDDIAANNDARLTNGLYRYTLSDKGVYTLTWVGCYADTYNAGYGRLEGTFTHTAKLAYITVGTTFFADAVYGAAPEKVAISESTKFVVKSVGAKWTTYTGYTALPELTASYMDYVDTDNDGYADIVYLGAAIFAGDSITGYVTNWGRFNWANGYDVVTVYVDGEPVYVNVKNPLGTTEFPTGDELVAGMYTFTMGTDKNDVAYATAYHKNAKLEGEVITKNMSSDSTAITVRVNGKDEPIGLTGVAIYEVKEDGTVVKADASAIVAGRDYVRYYEKSNLNVAPFAELYIIDGYTPAP